MTIGSAMDVKGCVRGLAFAALLAAIAVRAAPSGAPLSSTAAHDDYLLLNTALGGLQPRLPGVSLDRTYRNVLAIPTQANLHMQIQPADRAAVAKAVAALQQLQAAAAANNSAAMCWLGQFYLVVMHDQRLAVPLMRNAAMAQTRTRPAPYPDAAYYYAMLWQSMMSVNPVVQGQHREKWIRFGSALGSPKAEYVFGRQLLYGDPQDRIMPNTKVGLKLIQTAAAGGSRAAQLLLQDLQR